MVKTQVQIPDELYRKAKLIAKQREWSLAEVMRRGLEYMTRTCPTEASGDPQLPVLEDGVFADDFDDLDFRELAVADEAMRGGGA